MLFLKQILNILNPFKSMNFLSEYFECVKQIKVARNVQIIIFFKCLLAVVFYQTLHFLYLFVNLSKSPYYRIIHYDVFYLLVSKNLVPLLGMLSSIQAAYNIYVLYFDSNLVVNQLLKRVLITKGQTFFLKRDNGSLKITTIYLLVLNIFYSSVLLVCK